MRFYVNLYHQGWYHRAGKPGCMSVHPGDMYPTEQAALNDIDQDAPYLATVPVEVPETVAATIITYDPDSIPVPLSATRAQFRHEGFPDAFLPEGGGVVPFPQSVTIRREMAEGSIETSEREAIEPPFGAGLRYKPAHGGYPG